MNASNLLKRVIPFLAAGLLLFHSGCAVSVPEVTVGEGGPVWPLPPFEPRIKYVRSIAAPQDIAIKKEKGWFGKAFDFITGGIGKEGSPITVPYGLFFEEKSGFLYVADRALKGIHRYDIKEGKALFMETIGDDDGYFEMPIALLLAWNKLYISDTVLKRVLIFKPDGTFIKDIKGFGRPGGMAYDRKNNRLYVVDVKESRIKAFDKDGNILFTFGKSGIGDGEFNLPSNIWVDKGGKIYITDSMNFRVQVFGEKGDHILSIGSLGDAPGYFARPRGVAVDSDGNIYVVDANFDNVQIFNQEGELLLFFGKSGIEPGEFTLPSGIFIDDNDMIYISDSYNRRVQVFRYIKGSGSDHLPY